jgi:alcohol dehydrogenase (cytochrome c)
MRGQGPSRTCPSNGGGKNWQPSAYNPELGLLYIPTIEGCNSITTDEQKSFVDQGGTVKPRERFAGGSTKALPNEKRWGAIKAVDPVTGETKASIKLTYPNWGGALATAGSLVFNGEIDGTFAAYDGRTMQQLWSFNTGTGINAPPVSYSSTASSTLPCWWVPNSPHHGGFPESRTRRPPQCCTCSACKRVGRRG